MSHIGKQPIELPAGTTAQLKDNVVTVKGPKGELAFQFTHAVSVEVKGSTVICTLVRSGKASVALWGTTRARIANMVKGVSEGFAKQLEMRGVGYRAAVKGKGLELTLGFSHPVTVSAPEGISFAVAKELITVRGIDNQVVGQVAASIRAIRPPEPYKGKGIRYLDEKVRRKVGKVVGATAT
jgi:large subunit ribosomal protein L6